MRILHVVDGIPPESLGGAGRIALEIASEQRKQGNETAILCAAPPTSLPETINGIRILTIPRLPDRFTHFRCVFSHSREREMLEKIQTFKPDVIHAHTISRQCGYRWMKSVKQGNIRLIVTCHDVSHVAYGKVRGTEKHLWFIEMLRYRWTWNPFRNVLIKRYLQNADAILAVSDALRDYLMRRDIPNVRTVHNGIDLNFWKPETTKTEARTKLGLPEHAFLFLLAGRMGYDKGSTLISATLPHDAGLILAGDNFSDEFAPVRNRMHIFKNQTAEQMKLQYAACDAVLVPSRCLDCFPTVCLEAMAMEKPVLATTMGGAKESVANGNTGWILDPWDENAWKNKMQWCIDHASELIAMGKNGRKRMEEEFTIERMAEQLMNIYTHLIP